MRWPYWGALGLVIAPLALLLLAVELMGVNTVIADELHYVDFIRLLREGGDWTTWLWRQHNEHRVVPLKLLMVLLSGPTRWSQQAEMFCSVALTVALVVALWRIYRLSGAANETGDVLAFAPLVWLAASLAQYENQLYGLMVCHYFTAAGAVVALALLGSRSAWSPPLAALSAVVAATSVASGLLVFPAGVVILAAQRRRPLRWLVWCGTGVVTTALYFRHYLTPPHAGPMEWSLSALFRIGKLALATLGVPLAARSLGWGLALGAALLVLSTVLLLRWLRLEREERARQAPAAALLLYGLATCAMVAVGRAFLLTPGDPLGSRYITHANLVWFGAHILLLAAARRERFVHLRAAVAGLLAVGLVAANLQGLAAGLEWRRERLLDQYVLQTIGRQTDAVLNRLGTPASVRPQVSYLRQQRLSAFAEPQRLLMLMDPATGVATAPVRRGQIVEQRLICPVDELEDVAVLVLPAWRPGDGSFSAVVAYRGRELGRSSFQVAAIKQWTWVRVPIERSFPCRGRELSVRVEAADLPADGGVMTLAAQPYYEGRLSQGGAALAGRQLGIAFNGYQLGILREGP